MSGHQTQKRRDDQTEESDQPCAIVAMEKGCQSLLSSRSKEVTAAMAGLLDRLYIRPLLEWLDKPQNKTVRTLVRFALPILVICLLVLIPPRFQDLLGPWSDVPSYLPSWSWIVFVLAGLSYGIIGIYFVVRFARPSKRWLSLLLIIMVASFSCLTGYWARPTETPNGALVVAIAKFNAIGKSSEDDALTIPNRIRNQLQRSLSDTVDSPVIRIKFLKKVQIEGQDEQEAISAAKEQARKASADLIIWGDVCREEESLEAIVRMAVANDVGNVRVHISPLALPDEFAPSHLTFKKSLANQVSQLTYFICGVIYFHSHKHDLALKVFDKLETQESYWYKGLIHSERAFNFPATCLELLKAKDALERAVKLESSRIVAAEGLNREMGLSG
jgi:hypothetical protein